MLVLNEICVCRVNYDVKLNYTYLNGYIYVDKGKICFFEHGITYVRIRSLPIEVYGFIIAITFVDSRLSKRIISIKHSPLSLYCNSTVLSSTITPLMRFISVLLTVV